MMQRAQARGEVVEHLFVRAIQRASEVRTGVRVCGRLLLIATLGIASGCGFLFNDDGIFRDRSEDYKSAPELSELTLPEGDDKTALRELYVIPQIEEGVLLSGEFEVPRPAPLAAGTGTDVVRIQKLGNQRWALIGVPPGQVWPQVRSFLAAANMPVGRVDARAGVMETAWLTLENQEVPARFRFRMEQGVQRGTSELHVLQMNQASVAASDDWPRASDNPTLEADMLQAVSQYLADSADTAPVSMMAEQGITTQGKISLQESPEGYTYIHLVLPFDRAWASLGLALQKSAFEVTDQDRTAGTYYTTFNGPEEEEDSSWFGWLWPGGKEDPLVGEAFIVRLQTQEDSTVAIRLQPEKESLSLAKREEQGLLTLIKGNIN